MDYFLIDNHLTSDPNDQIAIPANIRSYGDEQIIDRIMQRGSTLTRPDLLAGIRAYQEEHGYIAEEGNGFNTGLLTPEAESRSIGSHIRRPRKRQDLSFRQKNDQ